MRAALVSTGYGFKGAVAYITHDAGEKSADRVDWVQTLNTVHDDPSLCGVEMAMVHKTAPLIKQQMGIKNTGRKAEHAPCLHFYISWHPDDRDKLTPEIMQEAALGLLKVYGLQDHQAVVSAHNDTNAPHIHIVANRVDWQTGKVANVKDGHNKLSRFQQAFEKKYGLTQIEKRQDNNRRRDEGEKVVGEFERDDYDKKRDKADEKKKAKQRTNDNQPAPAFDYDQWHDRYAAQYAKRIEEPQIMAELKKRHKAEWSELTASQRKARADHWAGQKVELGKLWRNHRNDIYNGFAAEARAAYDEAKKGCKGTYKKEWAAQFRQEVRELQAFDSMSALTRAGYYMRRMLDGSGVRVGSGVVRQSFAEKQRIRPDHNKVGFTNGLLRAFFNDPVVMQTLRDEVKAKHAAQRKAILDAQYAPAHAAAQAIWDKVPERVAEWFDRTIGEPTEQLKAVHAYEREVLREQQTDARDQLRRFQSDERRAARRYERGEFNPDALADRPPPDSDRMQPVDRGTAYRRPDAGADALARPDAPPQPVDRGGAYTRPDQPQQQRPQQVDQAQRVDRGTAYSRPDRVAPQRPASPAEPAKPDARSKALEADRKLLADAAARAADAKRTEDDAKTRANNTPQHLAYTLAERFKQNAQARQTAKEAAKEKEREQRGLSSKFQRERDR